VRKHYKKECGRRSRFCGRPLKACKSRNVSTALPLCRRTFSSSGGWLPKGDATISMVELATARLAHFDAEHERLKREYADVFALKDPWANVSLITHILHDARADHMTYLVSAQIDQENEKSGRHAS